MQSSYLHDLHRLLARYKFGQIYLAESLSSAAVEASGCTNRSSCLYCCAFCFRGSSYSVGRPGEPGDCRHCVPSDDSRVPNVQLPAMESHLMHFLACLR